MKELKEFTRHYDILEVEYGWNPVKELKVMIMNNGAHRIFTVVESGEGIESELRVTAYV